MNRSTAPPVLRLDISVDGSAPVISRTLDIRADVTLDVLHECIQAAFGWDDYHLHRFSLSDNPFDHRDLHFLCPFDVQEGDTVGIPAATAVLGEVVHEPGDRLTYLYDYGDMWQLTLRVDSRQAGNVDSPIAVCMGGAGAAPPENSGGSSALRDMSKVVDDPALFDIDVVNQRLRAPHFVMREAGVNPDLINIVYRLTHTEIGPDLIARALALAEGPLPSAPHELAGVIDAFTWFLDRAALDGIQLTASGYLPPADVIAVMRDVPRLRSIYGVPGREVNARSILWLRTALQDVGLFRKVKGKLLLTKAGEAARQDPERLWAHLAARIVPGRSDSFEQQSALLFLLHTASSTNGEPSFDLIRDALHELGWRKPDQTPLEPRGFYFFEDLPFPILRNFADQPDEPGIRYLIGPTGVALARAALRSTER